MASLKPPRLDVPVSSRLAIIPSTYLYIEQDNLAVLSVPCLPPLVPDSSRHIEPVVTIRAVPPRVSGERDIDNETPIGDFDCAAAFANDLDQMRPTLIKLRQLLSTRFNVPSASTRSA